MKTLDAPVLDRLLNPFGRILTLAKLEYDAPAETSTA
jgi:hypothetical protein